jgi:hypothetical protein
LNILIDASIFQFSHDSGNAQYWQFVVSKLPAAMPKDNFVVLWRSPQSFLGSHEPNVTVLAVPPADYNAVACECQRLTTLCNQLNIDVFLGSFYTAPSSSVPTLLVVYDMHPELFPTRCRGDDSIILAKKYAIKTTRRFVVFRPEDAENLFAFYDIRMARISSHSFPPLVDGSAANVAAWELHIRKLCVDIMLAAG